MIRLGWLASEAISLVLGLQVNKATSAICVDAGIQIQILLLTQGLLVAEPSPHSKRLSVTFNLDKGQVRQ